MVSTIPYNCDTLSKAHELSFVHSDGTVRTGQFTFFDRFFLDPKYSPDDYVSVDKDDNDLLPHECNWVFKWDKICSDGN